MDAPPLIPMLGCNCSSIWLAPNGAGFWKLVVEAGWPSPVLLKGESTCGDRAPLVLLCTPTVLKPELIGMRPRVDVGWRMGSLRLNVLCCGSVLDSDVVTPGSFEPARSAVAMSLPIPTL